jgi:hypothetical protein
MGHNDIDYEHKTNKDLSHTFGNPAEDKLDFKYPALAGYTK